MPGQDEKPAVLARCPGDAPRTWVAGRAVAEFQLTGPDLDTYVVAVAD
jgi:hypothetical protein